MSTIEEEIAAVKRATQKKLHRLRERDRKEQQLINLRIITLLRDKNPGAYEALLVEARALRKTEATKRAERARRAPLPPVDATHTEFTNIDDLADVSGWHGMLEVL